MTVDFILSISLFILLLAIFYSVWERNVQRVGDAEMQALAEESARRGLAALAESPGFPSSWQAQGLLPNQSSLGGLGAANEPGRLDAAKLSAIAADFNDSSQYNNTRIKLGVAPFESDVRVYFLDGTDIERMGNPPGDGSVVWASAQRLVDYGGQPALVRVRVWRNQT